MIATALTLPAGAGTAPLIIVAAVTGYLVTIWLSHYEAPDVVLSSTPARSVAVAGDDG